MSSENKELRQQETEDFMNLLFPEIDMKPYIQKKKIAVNIPDIKPKEKEDVAKPTSSSTETLDALKPETLSSAVEDATFKDEITKGIQELKDSIQDLEREERLKEVKEEMADEFKKEIRSLQKELNDLRDRKVPQRMEFETDGAYKEHLFPIATNVLDRILVPMLNTVPDYNLIATQISSTFEDGSVQNGIITMNIIIPNNDYRYDFKVDLPILNGLIQTPSFITRGRKVIPLTQKDVYEEINTYSFRKLDVNKNYKHNPFSNVGENIHRKEDNQKFYEVNNQEPPSVGVSDKSKWRAMQGRGLI